MPLLKKGSTNGSTATATPPTEAPQATIAKTTEQSATRKRQPEMTKDDYWKRREERDIDRDKHMAWSGLAQAALNSVSVAQLNTDNTEDGLVSLVSRIVDKLLKVRDSR
jgi:hypothetical protein